MKKCSSLIVLFILAFFIGYFHFYKLSSLPFRAWDEARLATSAYEMSKSGDLMVVTLNHSPDLIGTKPPLMIWAQAAWIKLIGLTEFAVRFPAAICAALTVLMVFVFIYKLTGSKWSGLASSIVLCTAKCYLFDHATRNGEYDSMLTLFSTAALLCFYLYTEAVNGKRDLFLLLFFFFLALGALTKGVAALLFAPGLFIYLLVRKQLVSTILNRYLFAGLVLFIIMVGAFYVLREIMGPGYLQAVAIQELGGRFNTVIEGHSGPWTFYWDYLKYDAFGNWYWVLPVSLLMFWFYPNPKLFRVTGFCLLTSIGLLTVLSCSQTKIWWYVLPAIPLFAIITGVLIDQLSRAVSKTLSLNKQIATVIIILTFAAQPALDAFKILNSPGDDLERDNSFALSLYLRKGIEGSRDFRDFTYLCGGYDIPWRLYAYRLNDLGVNISCIPFWDAPHFHAGDKVIANIPEAKNYVESNYQYKMEEEFYGVKNYLITSVK